MSNLMRIASSDMSLATFSGHSTRMRLPESTNSSLLFVHRAGIHMKCYGGAGTRDEGDCHEHLDVLPLCLVRNGSGRDLHRRKLPMGLPTGHPKNRVRIHTCLCCVQPGRPHGPVATAWALCRLCPPVCNRYDCGSACPLGRGHRASAMTRRVSSILTRRRC